MASFFPPPKEPPSKFLKSQKEKLGDFLPIEQASESSKEAYRSLYLRACFDSLQLWHQLFLMINNNDNIHNRYH